MMGIMIVVRRGVHLIRKKIWAREISIYPLAGIRKLSFFKCNKRPRFSLPQCPSIFLKESTAAFGWQPYRSMYVVMLVVMCPGKNWQKMGAFHCHHRC
jgi:hypothetical protein